jgi:carnitine 3-dehydrogenase
VRSALISGAKQLTEGRSNHEWAHWRDDALVDFFHFVAQHPYPTDI